MREVTDEVICQVRQSSLTETRGDTLDMSAAQKVRRSCKVFYSQERQNYCEKQLSYESSDPSAKTGADRVGQP